VRRLVIVLAGAAAAAVVMIFLIVSRDVLQSELLIFAVSHNVFSSDEDLRSAVRTLGMLRCERAVPSLLGIVERDHCVDEESYKEVLRYQFVKDALIEIGEPALPAILEKMASSTTRLGGDSLLTLTARGIYQRSTGDRSRLPSLREALDHWADGQSRCKKLRESAARALLR
jgi:hypothetical protein